MNTQKRAITALYIISLVLLLHQLTGSVLAYIAISYPQESLTSVQSILTIPSLVGLVVSFLVGPLALKISKRVLLIISASCILIYFAIFAAVGANGPFSLLLVAAAFAGICQGSAITLISSAVAETVSGDKCANVMAVSGALMNGGAALMNLVGGPIASGNGGANWPFAYYAGILILPAIVLFAIMMPKKPEPPAIPCDPQGMPIGEPAKAQKEKIPMKVFAMISVVMILALGLCVFMFNISTYIITEYKLGSSTQAGLANSMFTIAGILVGFTYPIWAKLFKKLIVAVGCALVGAGLLILMLVHTNILGAYVGAVVMGLGFNMVNPYVMAQVMSTSPPRLVPVSMSLMAGGMNLSMFGALYILSFLSGLLGGGLQNTLLVGVFAGAVSAVAAFFIFGLAKTPAPPSGSDMAMPKQA